jgi:hypothetical protein
MGFLFEQPCCNPAIAMTESGDETRSLSEVEVKEPGLMGLPAESEERPQGTSVAPQ